jgi:hypothetical protein
VFGVNCREVFEPEVVVVWLLQVQTAMRHIFELLPSAFALITGLRTNLDGQLSEEVLFKLGSMSWLQTLILWATQCQPATMSAWATSLAKVRAASRFFWLSSATLCWVLHGHG